MTPKQKLRSINKKMERIKNNNVYIDYEAATRHFYDIERYYKLSKERFFLEFEINHCEKCGKEYGN